jgi:hypothetical protein
VLPVMLPTSVNPMTVRLGRLSFLLQLEAFVLGSPVWSIAAKCGLLEGSIKPMSGSLLRAQTGLKSHLRQVGVAAFISSAWFIRINCG